MLPVLLLNHYYVLLLVTKLCQTLCNPMDCGLPGFSVLGDSPARIVEWVAMSSSRESSQSRDQTQVSRTAGEFFTDWAPGKPKNTGVSSLSLLQGSFLTQELNRGLLHRRRILYYLSHQGSPFKSQLILIFLHFVPLTFCISNKVYVIVWLVW